MSLGVVHLMVFWWGEIQVASLGEDQFSLGATAPPSSAILSLMVWWSSGKRWSGGSLGGSSSSSLSESVSSFSILGLAPVGPDCHSSSLSPSSAVPSSSARTMPSSRM